MSFMFFESLFPVPENSTEDQGYVVLATYPKGYAEEGTGPTHQHWFAWPSQKDDLVAFCLRSGDKDIYTSPALFKEKGGHKGEKGRRRKENIAHQWAVYADADEMDLAKFKAEPTMVVETSPGRHHVYWVTQTDDYKRLVGISRSVASTHAEDKCDNAGGAARLLRVPGTANTKYKQATGLTHNVMILRTGKVWDIADLEDIYPQVEDKKSLIVHDLPPLKMWHYTPESVEEANGVYHVRPDLYQIVHAEVVEGQDRSKTMWRLLCELARLGTSRTTALHMAWSAKCNKYEEDGRSIEELWNELCKAYEDPQNQPVASSIDVDERTRLDASEDNPNKKATDFISSISLLTPEERSKVPNDTFVDLYTAWAETCTDAPSCYHRAGAVTMLSAIFGEYGKCPTKFDINLTLWFLTLGPTTRARKSTAMMLWVDFLTDLEDSRYTYILTSDTTPEALSMELMKRDGRTSLFYRDEVHGLLYEESKKKYMAGFREYTTELYGGRVRSRLRASIADDDEDEGNKKPHGNVRTNFVTFLCGTLEQVTDELTISDYQSGYMARFLVAVADPPPLTKESMWMDQHDGLEQGEDTQRKVLIDNMRKVREFWHTRCNGHKNLRMIPFTPDAWERFNAAKSDVYETAQAHEMEDLLLPTTDRMSISIMKCAVLLAMAEGSHVVLMGHVLKAVELAEDWYAAIGTIAGRIMHSEWSGRQEEILTKIRSRTDGVTQQEIYRTFRSRMQEKEIESALNVLMKSGLIRRIDENDGKPDGRIKYIRTHISRN